LTLNTTNTHILTLHSHRMYKFGTPLTPEFDSAKYINTERCRLQLNGLLKTRVLLKDVEGRWLKPGVAVSLQEVRLLWRTVGCIRDRFSELKKWTTEDRVTDSLDAANATFMFMYGQIKLGQK
jgi:hypothetical protein